ncbi:MAG: hypothetical protein V4479_13865, partial [Actinomycetota bacterium]
MRKSPSATVRPARGVHVADAVWNQPQWGIAVSAPPPRIDLSSTDSDLAAAERAAFYGLGTIRPTGGWWRGMIGLPVHPTESVVLTGSLTRFLGLSVVSFARIHWLAVGVLVFALTCVLLAGWQLPAAGLGLLLIFLGSLLVHELGHAAMFCVVRTRGQVAALVISRTTT